MNSLENPDYVANLKALWKCPPKGMMVIEFSGDGDPAFGGSADDRALGKFDAILPRGSNEPRAEFTTIDAAHEAAKTISNRRPNSILGTAPWW